MSRFDRNGDLGCENTVKQFLMKLRQIAISGFFFLFPIYVVFIVISKAWMSLTSIGSKLAAMFGLKTVLGVGGYKLLTSLLIIAIWLLCGLLARVSFIGAFSRAAERTISGLIPGYASYRAIAEEKIARKTKVLPYTSAWLKQGDCDQPVFISTRTMQVTSFSSCQTFRTRAEGECSLPEQTRCG